MNAFVAIDTCSMLATRYRHGASTFWESHAVKKNPLREALRSGRPTIGTRLSLFDPVVVETIGQTGSFDYVEFGGEYAGYDLKGLENFCRAAEIYSLGTMIKLDWEGRGFAAQRSIGAGFDGVLFADARSADDVAQSVRFIRPETPEDGGLFGASPRRHALPSHAGTPAYIQALNDVVVAIMIEKRGAVEHLEEIAAVPGIDMVQFGPNDYAMSIGRPGQAATPDIRDVERRVIKTFVDAGIPIRAEIASVDAASYYLDLGVRHFSLYHDLQLIHSAWKDGGTRLREVVEIA
jgi:2-keto-3-deoxy-L-rhamnonate aldolase RhmA